MEYGVESVIDWGTGVLIIPESCVANWGSLKRVRFYTPLLVIGKAFLMGCRVGQYIMWSLPELLVV